MTTTDLGVVTGSGWTRNNVVSSSGSEVVLVNGTTDATVNSNTTFSVGSSWVGAVSANGYISGSSEYLEIGVINGADPATARNPGVGLNGYASFYGFLINIGGTTPGWYPDFAGVPGTHVDLPVPTGGYNVYRVAYLVNGTALTMYLYRDGVRIATATGTAPSGWTSVRPGLGARGGPGLFKFSGNPTWDDVPLTGIGVTNLLAYPVNGEAFLTWSSVDTATSYDYRVNGGSPVSVTTPSALVTGLTNGTAYTIEVRPINISPSGGTGAWTSVSVTPAAAYMFDDFERANATPSGTALGTSQDGHTWSQNANIGISSGQAYITSGIENYAYVSSAGYDQDISMYIPVAQSSIDQGIIFRLRDTSNHMLLSLGGNAIVLYRMIGGSYSALWTITSSISGLTSRPNILVRVTAVGSTVTLYLDSKRIVSWEDTYTLATDTGLGMRVANVNARVEWFYAKQAVAPTGVASSLRDVDRFGSSQGSIASYVYKGRDTQALDTVGAA